MVDSYRKNNSLDNKIISVKIVDVVDGGDKHTPKLEYKAKNNHDHIPNDN